MPTGLIVAGGGGRMAREILAAAAHDNRFEVVGATVRPGSLAGRDFAGVTGQAADGALVTESLQAFVGVGDVVVDFTTPAATMATGAATARTGRGLVVGTTGLSDVQLAELRSLGRDIPILYSRNTSVGVNALLAALPALAKALQGYDIEITEAHHRHKKDAPSGTALAIAEALVGALGVALKDVAVYGREGIQPRQLGEIGIHALRGGGNAGEHTILFADEGEQIQVVHRAYSRRTFALGALRAAAWVHGRVPGFYTMADMLAG
jgi:4-hydroxy-tetrahydrodipicolinate reductase